MIKAYLNDSIVIIENFNRTTLISNDDLFLVREPYTNTSNT